MSFFDELLQQIVHLTVPCADDGHRFTSRDRLDRIVTELNRSPYVLLDSRPLAYVYRHQEYDAEKPTILISNHIDSLYSNYFTNDADNVVHGTFDNSACNAVAVASMVRGMLAPQALIAFTGDEEDESTGADQTMEILRMQGMAFRALELVITLDLTEEAYGSSHFTIENSFVTSRHDDSLLRFSRKRKLKRYLRGILGDPTFVKNAEADESWQYDEYDLNCFSLCLPCALLGHDMHDDSGVMIRKNSLMEFAGALQKIVCRIANDLATQTP